MPNYYQNNNYGSNRSYGKKPSRGGNLDFKTIERIGEPLSIYYANKPDVFLIDGPLYQIANSIQKLSSSQLRKTLDLTKEALTIVKHSESDFEKARTRLFTLLPMLAYNTGRASRNDKENFNHLLEFIYKNVNPESIQCPADIQMFDQLITAVVAYHKYLGGK